MKKNQENKKIIIIAIAAIAIIAIISFCIYLCVKPKSYKKIIDKAKWDYTGINEGKNVSIDEKTGRRYANNIIYIVFDSDCSEESMAKVIDSIGGKIVGGTEEYKSFYIEVKKSDLQKLEKMCEKLQSNEDLYAYVEYYDEEEDWGEDPGEEEWIDEEDYMEYYE